MGKIIFYSLILSSNHLDPETINFNAPLDLTRLFSREIRFNLDVSYYLIDRLREIDPM